MRIFELLEDEGHYYIVSELISGGELYNRIVSLRKFSEVHAATIISQVLLAINYMHAHKIMHRDLKPENILMDSDDLENFNIKITDFGFACHYNPLEK